MILPGARGTAVGALGLCTSALEVLLGLLADVGVEGQEASALLDLVGGDGLVVDEHDDGLLALRGVVGRFSALVPASAFCELSDVWATLASPAPAG